jgi:hypothetical protein
MDTTKTNPDEKPFSDWLNRIGEQAKNWDSQPRHQMDLDILTPSQRSPRRSPLTTQLALIAAVAVFAVLAAQTFWLHSEIRAQRGSIEQLNAGLKSFTREVSNLSRQVSTLSKKVAGLPAKKPPVTAPKGHDSPLN